MKKTAAWLNKQFKFADVLPKSDLTEEQIVEKQGPFKGNDVSNISKLIPQDIAKQIEKDFGHIKFLNNGMFGVVYENRLRPGWLIKVTTSIEEINALNEIKDLGEIPCLVSYGRSKVYVSSSGERIGVIETKRVPLLSSDEARMYDYARSFIDFSQNWGEEEEGYRKYLEYHLINKNPLVSESIDFEGYVEAFHKLKAMLSCLSSYNFEHFDMKADNIGKESDGRYVIFDFGGLISYD